MKRFTLFSVLIACLVSISLVFVSCTTLEPTPTQTPSPLSTPSVAEIIDALGDEYDGEPIVIVQSISAPDVTPAQVPPGNIAGLLTAAGFLSLVANRLVEAFFTPIFNARKLNKLPLMYIAWAIGSILVFASNINLFSMIPGITMNPTIGLVMSAIVAGGGSNLLHELWDTLGLRAKRSA